jgi:hypothetical protein
VHAHLAATYALQYFVESGKAGYNSARDTDGADRFAEGVAGFERAIDLYDKVNGEPYVWAIRFLAFLYALHGKNEDFATSRRLLKSVAGGGAAQSAIDRSITMLDSFQNNTAANTQAVESGLSAVCTDPEDYIAPYFVAASLVSLRGDASTPSPYDPLIRAAIEGATMKVRNAISRAKAMAFGLALLRTSLPGADGERALAEAKQILVDFRNGNPKPDLETMAIVRHEPRWKQERDRNSAAFLALRDDFKAVFGC